MVHSGHILVGIREAGGMWDDLSTGRRHKKMSHNDKAPWVASEFWWLCLKGLQGLWANPSSNSCWFLLVYNVCNNPDVCYNLCMMPKCVLLYFAYMYIMKTALVHMDDPQSLCGRMWASYHVR